MTPEEKQKKLIKIRFHCEAQSDGTTKITVIDRETGEVWNSFVIPSVGDVSYPGYPPKS